MLADTNVILEAHRTRSWRTLTGGYRVETVEDCIAETQNGFQRRRPELQIDAAKLRGSLKTIHPFGDRERADLAIRISGIELDRGEASLWSHALTRTDAWVLCEPDKASLRCGVRLGYREQLVSLEGLLDDVGHRPGTALNKGHRKRWHLRAIGELVLLEEHGLS